MMKNYNASGTKLPVKSTLRERDLIRNETSFDAAFAESAVVKGKSVIVDLSLEDIEEIQGYVAAEANHTKNSRLQNQLDRLFDKLQALLDAYEEKESCDS